MGSDNQKTGTTPEDIKNIVLENGNLKNEVSNLKNEIIDLKNKLANYEKIAKGQIQNINSIANMNLSQAYINIDFLQKQNNALVFERNNLQYEKERLKVENWQLKFNNYKMQLMLLNQMQNTSMKDNIMAAKNLNTPQGNANMNNNNNMNQMMNNNNNNFNYNENKDMITIVFNINNKLKFNISTLPNHKLGNIFLLALYQNGYSNFINIKDFYFRYSTQNITNLFHENKEVKCINSNPKNFLVIDVTCNNL